jgi:exopolysaccharide production protein ExoZ
LLILWPFSYHPLQNFIGRTGIELFFILSGYLIWASATQSLEQKNGVLKYAINRVTRIYPLYLICILSVILLSNYFLGYIKPEISTEIVIRHLFLLQSFSPNLSDKLNAPFWTLTHEFMFYVLVPFLYFIKPTFRWLIASIVITQFFVYAMGGLSAFVNYWCLFAVGILIQQNQKIFNKRICCLLLFVFGLACITYKNIDVFEFLFAIALFNWLLNFEFKHFFFKPLVGLGIISYSVYVWHYILIHLISPYVKNVHVLIAPNKPWLPYGFLLEALLIIVFIFIFATLSYWLIEKPSMTTLRKKLLNHLT